jgi:hypothetical protein
MEWKEKSLLMISVLKKYYCFRVFWNGDEIGVREELISSHNITPIN